MQLAQNYIYEEKQRYILNTIKNVIKIQIDPYFFYKYCFNSFTLISVLSALKNLKRVVKYPCIWQIQLDHICFKNLATTGMLTDFPGRIKGNNHDSNVVELLKIK